MSHVDDVMHWLRHGIYKVKWTGIAFIKIDWSISEMIRCDVNIIKTMMAEHGGKEIIVVQD